MSDASSVAIELVRSGPVGVLALLAIVSLYLLHRAASAERRDHRDDRREHRMIVEQVCEAHRTAGLEVARAVHDAHHETRRVVVEAVGVAAREPAPNNRPEPESGVGEPVKAG